MEKENHNVPSRLRTEEKDITSPTARYPIDCLGDHARQPHGCEAIMVAQGIVFKRAHTRSLVL